MNVYSELLELLTPERKDAPAGLFGTLTAVSPLTVTVRGTALTEGLFYLQGTVFRREDIGRELALLSCEEHRGKLALFGGIRNARFRRKVIPGDVLRLETELIKLRGMIGVAKATAYVDGKVCTEAELTFVIQQDSEK